MISYAPPVGHGPANLRPAPACQKRLPWLPASWGRGFKMTAGGNEQRVFVSPEGKIHYHKKDVERTLEREKQEEQTQVVQTQEEREQDFNLTSDPYGTVDLVNVLDVEPRSRAEAQKEFDAQCRRMCSTMCLNAKAQSRSTGEESPASESITEELMTEGGCDSGNRRPSALRPPCGLVLRSASEAPRPHVTFASGLSMATSPSTWYQERRLYDEDHAPRWQERRAVEEEREFAERENQIREVVRGLDSECSALDLEHKNWLERRADWNHRNDEMKQRWQELKRDKQISMDPDAVAKPGPRGLR